MINNLINEIMTLKIIIISSNTLKLYLIKDINLVFLKGLSIIIVYFKILIGKYPSISYLSTLLRRAYLIRVINKSILLRIIIRDKL